MMLQPGGERPGDCLVCVNAQVMAWDDKFSGWLPYDSGGVSAVSLHQWLAPISVSELELAQAQHPQGSVDTSSVALEDMHQPTVARYKYFIVGRRLDDNKVLLNCPVSKDLKYHQVMPTFHHWQINDDKFGLKFMTSYEACKFHNKVNKAVEHLTRQSKSSSGESNLDGDDLDDEVFVPVELPQSRDSSGSSSGRASQPLVSRALKKQPIIEANVVIGTLGQAGYPYVEFQRDPTKAAQEYHSSKDIRLHSSRPITQQPSHIRPQTSAPNLPLIESQPSGSVTLFNKPWKRGSEPSVKMAPISIPFQSSKKSGSSTGSAADIIRRDQCIYCRQYYTVRSNVRGSCAEAPDACDKWIRRLTCLWCVNCVLYCCCQEEDAPMEDRGCRRWTTVALLALFLPCLWCYPPLAVCQRCCKRCGFCAGKHKAMRPTSVDCSRSEYSSSYK